MHTKKTTKTLKTKKIAKKTMGKSSKAMRMLEKLSNGRLTLGEAIRAIRQCDDIKQVDFAKKLGVTKSYLSDLENDRKEVSPRKAAEFAKILKNSEKQFVRLAIQDMLERQGLHYDVQLAAA